MSATAPGATPLEPGRPSVTTPEPALASSASACPWYPPSILMMRERPVKPRAARSADIVASVPDETNRIFSSDGIMKRTSSPSSTSRAVGAPNDVPDAAA